MVGARFFVIDNGFADGPGNFCRPSRIATCSCSRASYTESWYGLEWQHALLEQYGNNGWCLVIDADQLSYPGYERKVLPDSRPIWATAMPKAYSRYCSTCRGLAPSPTRSLRRSGRCSTPPAILTASTSGAASFLVCRGRNFQNITSLAARDSDCFFSFLHHHITY
jgi:glycosyl transferase family 2